MKKRILTFDTNKRNPDMPDFVWTNDSVTMTGKAFPESAPDAWIYFINELEDFFAGVQMKMINRQKFTVNFKLDFYNSASNTFISKMYDILQSNWTKCDITVNWYYLEADEDTEADGEMYRDSSTYNKITTKLIMRDD